MYPRKTTKKNRSAPLFVSIVPLFVLVTCLEVGIFIASIFGAGVYEFAEEAQKAMPATPDVAPVYLPTVDADSIEPADDDLSVGESVNSGRHRYTIAERQVRNKFFGVNLMSRPVFTHTITGDSLILEEAVMSSSGKVFHTYNFTKIAPNTYQGERSTWTNCSLVSMTLVYNVDGFSLFHECIADADEELQALIRYEFEEERPLPTLPPPIP